MEIPWNREQLILSLSPFAVLVNNFLSVFRSKENGWSLPSNRG